jgi:pimeloyl-ACP methyl ester carboxylesterase
MGAEDHLFLPSIRKIVSEHSTAEMFVVENCGHVVNVQRPLVFNEQSLRFLKGYRG